MGQQAVKIDESTTFTRDVSDRIMGLIDPKAEMRADAKEQIAEVLKDSHKKRNWFIRYLVLLAIDDQLPKSILKKWGNYDYSLYGFYSNIPPEDWIEVPDYKLTFKGYNRKSDKYRGTDPDRALASELKNKILDILIPLVESQDKTRINIFKDSTGISIELLDH